jgi:hypothetical protein
MELDKYEVYKTFYNNNDKTMKVRTRATALQDTIYRGMLRSDFQKEGYTKQQMRRLIKQGWIEERQILYGNSHRAVVVWLDQEMTPSNIIKRFIFRFKNFVKELKLWFKNWM